MPGESIHRNLEGLSRMSPEEVEDTLPVFLAEVRECGVSAALEQVPDFLWTIITKVLQTDSAGFARANPKLFNEFMELLWETVGVLSDKSEEMRSLLARSREVNVNLEASDSPLRCHFTIRQGSVAGAHGLLHFGEQDFRFFGPTKVLIGLLCGELPLGLNDPRLQTDGHPGFLRLLAPVIHSISKLIKGQNGNR